jgi:flagellar hook assembly protein FlgD
LQDGKSLYIEGTDFGAYNAMEQLYGMFGCTFIDYGLPSFVGNVISLEGQDGTIAESMSYDYLYQQGPDNYVDEIGENGGTLFFKSQDGKGRTVYYGGSGNSYRAIHSTVIFGALANGANTKDNLMNVFMNYLTELTGIQEYAAEQGRQVFSVFPNPVATSANISFSLSRPARVTTSIYNTAGQLVRRIADEEFAAGDHILMWHGDDNNGRRPANGTYFLTVKFDDDVLSKPIVILR